MKNKKTQRYSCAFLPDDCLNKICCLLQNKYSEEKIRNVLQKLSIEENVYEELDGDECDRLDNELLRAFTIVAMVKTYGLNKNIVPYILKR